MDVSKKCSALVMQSRKGRTLTSAQRLRNEKSCPYAFLGSNEATYGLREGGAGFHQNRPEAGKAKPTLSAGIVRSTLRLVCSLAGHLLSKRYGLPKPMVERALLEVYQTVVLDQQRYRDHS